VSVNHGARQSYTDKGTLQERHSIAEHLTTHSRTVVLSSPSSPSSIISRRLEYGNMNAHQFDPLFEPSPLAREYSSFPYTSHTPSLGSTSTASTSPAVMCPTYDSGRSSQSRSSTQSTFPSSWNLASPSTANTSPFPDDVHSENEYQRIQQASTSNNLTKPQVWGSDDQTYSGFEHSFYGVGGMFGESMTSGSELWRTSGHLPGMISNQERNGE
jgi:hypothetical protein